MTVTNLDEAIQHCLEVAEEEEKQAIWLWSRKGNPNYENCVERAKKQRQLASWLTALKEIWDSGDCNDCGNRGCLYKPKLGQLVRYNCPFYRKEVKTDGDSD